jgi:putative endonuclease
MMASEPHGTLYIGVTNDLARRVWEHKEGIVEGFTKKHDLKRLVFFEEFESMSTAIE